MKKLEAELTESEYDVLVLSLGAALGVHMMNQQKELAITLIAATNKLLANCPEFVPYDIATFDPERKGFPCTTVKPQ